MEQQPTSGAAQATPLLSAAIPAQRARLVLFVMCAGMFLVLLDVTVVNVAIPSISAGLGTTTAGVQWVVDGYTVALASLLLAGGALGDLLGHRQVVAAGLVIFGAASAGCALVPSSGVLIATRALQGLGAGIMLPGSIAAIADAHPERAAQARALGIWAGVSSVALPVGPMLGGLLVSTLGWRAVFWINPPVSAVCLAGVLVWVKGSGERCPRRLDAAGLALGTLSLAAVVYAVIAAGSDAVVAAAAGAIGALAIGALVVIERRVAEPLLPVGLFGRAFAAANGSALVMNLTSNGLLFALTRYLQSVLGASALEAGIMLLPLFVPLAVLNGLNLPVLLLAGVLLPISLGPLWLRILAHFDPLYYLVAAARALGTGHFTGPHVWQAFAVLVPLALLILAWATRVVRHAVS